MEATSSVDRQTLLLLSEYRAKLEDVRAKKLQMEDQYRLTAERRREAAERKVKAGQEARYNFLLNERLMMEQSGEKKKQKELQAKEKVELAITTLTNRYNAEKAALEAKLKLLDEKVEAIDEDVQKKKDSYYSPALEKLLETSVPLEINYPPSYDKLVAQENDLLRKMKPFEIAAGVVSKEDPVAPQVTPTPFDKEEVEKEFAARMAALEAKSKQRQSESSVKVDSTYEKAEREMKQRREQVRLEQEQEEAKRRQREEAEKEEKLALLEAERREAAVKQEEKEIPRIPSQKEKEREQRKLALLLEEARKAEEYKLSRESDGESAILDSEDEDTPLPPPPRKYRPQPSESTPSFLSSSFGQTKIITSSKIKKQPKKATSASNI